MLSLLDENYVPTSKKVNLEYHPKTSSSLQYQNDLFSAVVVEVMKRVMNDVFQKSVCIVSLHWGAKIPIKNPFGIHEVVAKLGLTKRRLNNLVKSKVQLEEDIF